MTTTILSSPSEENEPFTVSKMLDNINSYMVPVVGESGAKVELKRKLDTGIMLNTSDQEIAYLDLQAKIKHTAQQVSGLEKKEKQVFIEQKRQVAKVLFQAKEYGKAAEKYMEALAALEFGTTEEEKKRCQEQIQLPITCNLTACMLMQEQWEKAKQMADHALTIDPFNIRALHQRAKAKVKLLDFLSARHDILIALEHVKSSSHHSKDKELKDFLKKIAKQEAIDQTKRQRQRLFEKKMMQQAVGKLYQDKKEVDQPRQKSNTDKSFKGLQQQQQQQQEQEEDKYVNIWEYSIIVLLLGMITYMWYHDKF
jgi:tetratricopeptide (TPR) repeat protein